MGQRKYPEPIEKDGKFLCPVCKHATETKGGYRQHFKKQLERGHEEHVEAFKDFSGDGDSVEKEKEIAELKAERHRLKRLLRAESKRAELSNRIAEVVEESVEEMPKITTPSVPQFEEYDVEHDETAVVFVSDSHVGKKTPTYNHEVFSDRMEQLGEKMIKLVRTMRTIRPIKRLVVVMGGDMVDAESVYPGQSVDNISVPVVDQIFTVGVPRYADFLNLCLDNFEKVDVYCVKGNHGKMHKQQWSSSKSSNWDFIFYKSLANLFRSQDRINFEINTKEWKMLFKIYDYGFLATHGDMIRMYYNLPYYGSSRQAQRWQATYRDRIKLHYFMFGHFHSRADIRFNQAVMFFNGSFVTDDQFAERRMGIGSTPEQWLFGVHPDYGISWRYPLYLEEDTIDFNKLEKIPEIEEEKLKKGKLNKE